MSILDITDLQQVEELSSARMRQVDGGMSCLGQQARMQELYFSIANVYYNVGATDAAAAMEQKGLEAGAKECP